MIDKKKLFKTLFNILFYGAGLFLIVFFLSKIGFRTILENIKAIPPVVLIGLIGLSCVAGVARVVKLNMLLKGLSLSSILEIYLFSKIGKELSIIGYFSPLFKKKLRKVNTAQTLIIDRYMETVATILIALFSLLFVFPGLKWKWFFLAAFVGLLAAAVLIVIFKVPEREFKFKLIQKIFRLVRSIQDYLSQFSKVNLYILLLSIGATIIDFTILYLVFSALGVSFYFFYVPIIWAISGFVALITFMNIGPGELSSIYLFENLCGINAAKTGSMIIVTRAISFTTLFLFFAVNLLFFSRKEKEDSLDDTLDAEPQIE